MAPSVAQPAINFMKRVGSEIQRSLTTIRSIGCKPKVHSLGTIQLGWPTPSSRWSAFIRIQRSSSPFCRAWSTTTENGKSDITMRTLDCFGKPAMTMGWSSISPAAKPKISCEVLLAIDRRSMPTCGRMRLPSLKLQNEVATSTSRKSLRSSLRRFERRC